jgi:hypothetical protein
MKVPAGQKSRDTVTLICIKCDTNFIIGKVSFTKKRRGIINGDMNTHLDKSLHIIIVRDNVIAWAGGHVIAYCLHPPPPHTHTTNPENVPYPMWDFEAAYMTSLCRNAYITIS